MLSTIVAAADRLVVAGGSITDSNSALYNPDFKYTHHQIVAGGIFDVVVCALLLGGMAFVAYSYWGPPAKRRLAEHGGVDDATTLREEGLLLGLQPCLWSIVSAAAFGLAVLASILYYGY